MAPFARKQVSAVDNRVLPPRLAHQHYYWQSAAYVESSRTACCTGHAIPKLA
jgi:hypothetical protein